MAEINIMTGLQYQKKAPSPQTAKRVLTSDDSYATTLLVLAMDRFGPECLEWAPMTLRLEIEETWGVDLPKLNMDKLMAAVAVVTTDMFFKDVTRFVQLCNVLSGSEFDPEEFDPADSLECAWGITEALLLSPPDEEDPEPFSDDVRRYVGLVLKEEGFVRPPDILRIALDADFSAKVRYDWTDDPEMFQAIHAVQQSKAGEVEDTLRENLLELLGQLRDLPLQQGNTFEVEKRLGALLSGKPDATLDRAVDQSPISILPG